MSPRDPVPATTEPSRPRRSLAGLYATLGVTAAAGAAALFWQLDLAASQPPQLVATALTPGQLQAAGGVSVGSRSAPVVLTEFGDFQCGACAHFSRSVMPPIVEEYVRSGRVRYVFHDFPITSIHPNAVAAARAARCADAQGRFKAFHDVLFDEQDQWSTARDPNPTFTAYARREGLEPARFSACLTDPRSADEVQRSVQFAATIGIQSTPTIFVNASRLASSPNSRQLRAVIEQELARVGTPGWAGSAAVPER
jgi:protein-disulfide isomerase